MQEDWVSTSSTTLLPLPIMGEGEGKQPVTSLRMHRKQVQRARRLRRASTEAEKLLWRNLLARQLGGAKFRRQPPIGPYIVDFVSFEHQLVVEIDGGQHNTPVGRQQDIKRTTWLENQGFRVLRFWNNQVLIDLEGVMESILQELEG